MHLSDLHTYVANRPVGSTIFFICLLFTLQEDSLMEIGGEIKNERKGKWNEENEGLNFIWKVNKWKFTWKAVSDLESAKVSESVSWSQLESSAKDATCVALLLFTCSCPRELLVVLRKLLNVSRVRLFVSATVELAFLSLFWVLTW